jgi:pyruvate formate lyase activating enzyme
MKQVYLYKKLTDKKVQCQNCAHYCIIKDNTRGKCNVKENIKGKLYSLVYGKVAALSIDPIEKKPLFHFLPGTYSLSFCTVGCNFKCLNCQNHNISQTPRENNEIFGKDLSPKKIVSIALENNLPSISYTYTEPAIFSEYALDVMKLAKKKGLKNIWVSNGFWSEELFNLIYLYLDAVNIDIKSSEDSFYVKYCGAKLKPVLDTLKRLKKKRIWTEITTLVIPTLNDKEKIFKEIANFIKSELGEETPWHIDRFFGSISWKLQNIPDTRIETLEKAKQIGEKVGLKHIYIGNI